MTSIGGVKPFTVPAIHDGRVTWTQCSIDAVTHLSVVIDLNADVKFATPFENRHATVALAVGYEIDSLDREAKFRFDLFLHHPFDLAGFREVHAPADNGQNHDKQSSGYATQNEPAADRSLPRSAASR